MFFMDKRRGISSILMSTLVLSVCVLCLYLANQNVKLRKSTNALTEQLNSLEVSSAPSVGSHLSSLRGLGLDGRELSLDFTHRSKPTLLLLLSPHCRFCVKQFPDWDTLAKAEGPANVVYADLSGAMDSKYVSEKHIDPASKTISLSPDEGIMRGFHGTPTTILIDPSGKVTEAWAGVMNQASFNEVMQQIQSSNAN
jgi:hypothetical protein